MIKNKYLILIICSLFYSIHSKSQNENDVNQYINNFKQYAIEEQIRTGVPAAITLAQGIHETAAGKSELATNANNHFGIKCKSNWIGETYFYDDDKKQECFRKYSNALQSYIDHSDFLKQSSRYTSLFELDITDYVGWSQGLKKAGYATNPLYSKKLIELVEKYNLQQFTYEALKNNNEKIGEIVPNQDKKKNDLNITDDPNQTYKGLKGFWAKKGDDINQLAAQQDVKPARLMEFNELQDNILPYDMFVFTQKKKRIGTVEFHNVQEGETMYLISQKEAMVIDNLYMFNNLKKGDEPMPGEQLSLQYKGYNTPKIFPKEEQKKSENIIENKVESSTIATVDESDIKDLEKAKKVESILTGKPIENSEIVIAKPIEEKKETIVENVKTTSEENVKEPEKPKEKPKAPKRTYNEKGVDEDVKEMKKKFDEMVYRPFERKVVKRDTTKTQTIAIKSNTGVNILTVEKKQTPKDSMNKTKITTNNANAKTEQSVQKTETGVKRDAKKIEEEKKKAEDEKKKTLENKKQTKVSPSHKEPLKKQESKTTDKKQTNTKTAPKPAQKADTKKTDAKTNQTKSTPKKK